MGGRGGGGYSGFEVTGIDSGRIFLELKFWISGTKILASTFFGKLDLSRDF